MINIFILCEEWNSINALIYNALSPSVKGQKVNVTEY